jgi:L-rhamnose mutarotase
MNSYVNIELDKATEKYNEINEYIIKEMANETQKTQIMNYSDLYKNVSEEVFNKYNNRENNNG